MRYILKGELLSFFIYCLTNVKFLRERSKQKILVSLLNNSVKKIAQQSVDTHIHGEGLSESAKIICLRYFI